MAALGEGDWARLRPLLHPYLHWTQDGVTVRGRTKVLAHLSGVPATGRPAAFELRDGQIYRWIAV